MKHKKEHHDLSLVLNVVIGVATFGLFCLLFPNGAVSTLMHGVLHLPGPGVGIGLIYAQLLTAGLIVSALSIHRRERRFPPVLFSALVVSLLLIFFSSVGGVQARNTEPILGLPFLVIVAVLLSALTVEIVSFSLLIERQHKNRSRFFGIFVTQSIGVFSCLVFYWFFIFPNVTLRVMPKLTFTNAIVMMGLTLVASLAFSALIHLGRSLFAD